MILITGAAGYIGSNCAHILLEKGREIITLDNLYSGFEWALSPNLKNYMGNCGDPTLLEFLFKKFPIKTIIHFAAHLEVEESTKLPTKYYLNNSLNTLQLIQTALKYSIKNFIFSSTCAVYGNPPKEQVDEETPLKPISPYGRSKLCSEWIIQDHFNSPLNQSGAKYLFLRYFNVAGANLSARQGLGQATKNATQLIKVACEVALKKRKELKIFGTDYPTPDGTCIRDYIHVEDLASAHYQALNYLEKGGESDIFNCGYGKGLSVKEVVSEMHKLVGRDYPIVMSERRAGDPVAIYSNPKKIMSKLEWQPKYNNISQICHDQFEFEKIIIKNGWDR